MERDRGRRGASGGEVNFPETEGGSKIVYFPRDKAAPMCKGRKTEREREGESTDYVREGRVSFPTLSERHVRVPVHFYDVIVY